MNRKPRRVVVVGGGPAGSAAALSLRLAGVDEVVVVEQHPEPAEVAWSGFLSSRALSALDFLGVTSALRQKAVEVRRARLVAPDGTVRSFAGAGTALSVHRTALADHLLDEARRSGVVVRRGAGADRLLRKGGTVVGVACGEAAVEADVVVLAAGARCKLTWDPRPRTRLDGVAVRYGGVDVEPGFVNVVFDPRLLPNYAWLLSEHGGTVSVGLCCGHGRARGPLPVLLDEVVHDHFSVLEKGTRLGEPTEHPILYSSSARYLVSGGVVVVGGAARLTDCFTGEGVWHALRSGIMAAEAVASGEPRRYELRARMTFDPHLLGARLRCRLVSSRAFPALLRKASPAGSERVLARLFADPG